MDILVHCLLLLCIDSFTCRGVEGFFFDVWNHTDAKGVQFTLRMNEMVTEECNQGRIHAAYNGNLVVFFHFYGYTCQRFICSELAGGLLESKAVGWFTREQVHQSKN